MLLAACSSVPAGIPNEPGTATAEDLPALMAVASPDLPLMLYNTTVEIALEDYRLCPRVTYAGVQMVADAGETCVDSAGITWTGSVVRSTSSDTNYYSFTNFGPRDGLDGGWVATGTLSAELTLTGAGTTIVSNVVVDSYSGKKTVLWVDTTLRVADYGGVPYADTYLGTIGLQDWGTAAVEGNRVVFASLNACTFAQHGSGDVALTAKNKAAFAYDHAVGAEGPAAPTSGGGARTGASDTSVDTGIPPLATVVCGDCATAFIGEEEVSSCVSPSLGMGWAFPPPF